MHNALNVVLAQVFSSVPPQLLQLGVQLANRYGCWIQNPTELIMQKIIRERVLLDVNVVGGKTKDITLKQAWLENTQGEYNLYTGSDGRYSVYRVPPEARDNVAIASVQSVSYPHLSSVSNVQFSAQGGYSVPLALNGLMDSYTMASIPNNPLAFLMAGDLVKIYPLQSSHQDWVLTCRLSYDEYFENIHGSALFALADLVELATKAFIYNTAFIDLDRAAMEFGHDIGAVRSAIEEWRDANDRYKESRVKMHGAQQLEPQHYAKLALFMT